MNKYSILLLTLFSIILIAITVSSLIIIPDDTIIYGEEELNEFIEEAYEEFATYIQVKDKIGKYYGLPPKIEKIALLISPLVSSEINLSSLNIKLNNGENVKLISYNKKIDYILTNYLFEHPIWDNLNSNEFGFLIINDEDKTLQDYNVLNSNTDMAYIIINLGDFSMNYKDTLIVTLFPSTGWEKTIKLVAALPVDNIVLL